MAIFSRAPAFPKIDGRLAIAGLACGLVMVLAATAVGSGSPAGLIVAIAVVTAPLLVYLALEHPILFPYGLYIGLMPYDVLLVVHTNSTLTKMLGETTGVLCLFYCLRARRISPIRSPLVALVLLLVWMSVSSLWSVNSDATMTWLPSYFGLALLYGALALMPVSLNDFKFSLGIVAFAFAVAAIFGIHAFYHDPTFRAVAEADPQRLSLKLGDSQIDQNHFANAFLFPIAILITALLRTNWLSLKALCSVGIGLMVTTMLMSGSREAVLALVIMIAYFLWRGRNRLQLVALASICTITALPFSSSLATRFADSFSHRHFGEPRFGIWAVGITAMKHYWFLGSGIGTFPDVYSRFYLAVASVHPDGWDRPAHDLFIHYTVETGIVGMALIGWFLIANFTMLRGIDRDHPLHDYRVMIEASLIGILTVSLFIDLFTYKYAWLVFATAAQITYLATTVRRAPGRLGASMPRNRVDVGKRNHFPIAGLDRTKRSEI